MQDLINQLITTAIGLSLLAGGYLIWLLTGIANNLFNNMKWSWKRTGEDIIKALLWGVAIIAWVALCYGLNWFAAQCGCDIKALMDGASAAGVIGGIIGGTVFYAVKAYKNILNFVNADHVEAVAQDPNYKAIADKIYELFETPKEAVEAHKEFEEEKAEEDDPLDGGRGVYYSVPHDSYENFRNAVNGNGYDIDGSWGAQCYDGAGLLWMQLGLWLSTGGTGAAKGCWLNARDENAGNNFELIYDKGQVQRGDVVVFSCGEFGHIGFADEDFNGGSYIRLLGQNQGGTAYPGGGSNFNVINMGMSTFIGAFRYKAWKKVEPAPQPEPQPGKKGYVTYTYKAGDTFGQVICNLGLKTSHGLWGPDGDVEYYSGQLHEQGIYGNIPIGTTIKLTPRG